MTTISEVCGVWALDNPECIEVSGTNDNVKMAQLCFCMVCVCQILFMASQYPKVGWEAIYLPSCECFLYGLASSGNGFIQLYDGRLIPWARYAAWICTCPSILLQINTIHKCKISHFNLNTFIVQADLIMNIMGVTGALTTNIAFKWIYFAIGCILFIFIVLVVYDIMTSAAKEWKAKGDSKGNLVSTRLILLRWIFIVSWCVYPLLWILSPQATCAVSEDVISVAHFICDAFAKNMFGFIMWRTLWRDLDGHWDISRHYPQSSYAKDGKEEEQMTAMSQTDDTEKPHSSQG
nr:PsChR1 [synthetic construct]